MDEQDTENRFGKYEILERIEEGIAGRLCRARDTESGRNVVLKIVAPAISENPEFGRYFYDKWSEQQSLVEHPNIVRVWEVGQEGDSYYVALEDTDGRRLSDELEHAPLETDEALDIIHQIAEGLRAIHRRDVFHGHVKPADVILTQDKLGRRLVKVALFDLGVSSEAGTVSVFGELLGAPKYMAPEVIRGRTPGPEADVFALGVIAYEMFTGREPFPSQHPVGYLFNNCEEEPQPVDGANPDAPREVALVIHRMLEKQPRDRYASVQRVIDDLDRCVETLKTGRSEVVPHGTDSAFARDYDIPAPKPEATQSSGLSVGYAAVLIVLVVATVGLGVYAVSNLGRGSAPRPPDADGAERAAATPGGPTAASRPSRTGPRPAEEERSAREAYQSALEDWKRYSDRGQYDLGVATFADVAQRYADTPFAQQARTQMARIYVEWAESLVDRSDYAGALEKYHEAANTAPEDSSVARLAKGKIPAATAGLAEAARSRGDYMAALEVYERIAGEHPGTVEAELLQQKKPELLFNQAFVLRDEGKLEQARDLLLTVINEYEDTQWSERAAEAVPDVYLRLARRELDQNNLDKARGQIRKIVEAYPGHEAAEEAARLDAQVLLSLFTQALQDGDSAKATDYYGKLLSLYPSSASSVRAVRQRLGLERPGNQAMLTDTMARSQLRKAKDHRRDMEFSKALDLLKIVVRDTRADSPGATEAVSLLPEWSYGAAMHAYGTGSLDECETLLADLSQRFPGTPWEEKGRHALARIQNPPQGMVYVPDGSFWMGTDLREIIEIARKHELSLLGGSREEMEVLAVAHGFSSEIPRHSASTDAFYIGQTEVTNQQYLQFVHETGHAPPSYWEDDEYPEGRGDYPVRQISASDARAYAAWAGGRLPTEAEWEKAARGVDGRRYPWGDRFREDCAQHMRSEDAGPTRVGSFKAWSSPYGCMDMIGNVMEWTTSRFAPYEGNQLEVPTDDTNRLVRRGGSWRKEELAPIPTRCASRYPAHPGEAEMNTGFRIVMDAEAGEKLADEERAESDESSDE
ncbi:MAG: SUMF1/EgtB/PvdO family nonheme iron enzyme [Planctomycetota bacterium]